MAQQEYTPRISCFKVQWFGLSDECIGTFVYRKDRLVVNKNETYQFQACSLEIIKAKNFKIDW